VQRETPESPSTAPQHWTLHKGLVTRTSEEMTRVMLAAEDVFGNAPGSAPIASLHEAAAHAAGLGSMHESPSPELLGTEEMFCVYEAEGEVREEVREEREAAGAEAVAVSELRVQKCTGEFLTGGKLLVKASE